MRTAAWHPAGRLRGPLGLQGRRSRWRPGRAPDGRRRDGARHSEFKICANCLVTIEVAGGRSAGVTAADAGRPVPAALAGTIGAARRGTTGQPLLNVYTYRIQTSKVTYWSSDPLLLLTDTPKVAFGEKYCEWTNEDGSPCGNHWKAKNHPRKRYCQKHRNKPVRYESLRVSTPRARSKASPRSSQTRNRRGSPRHPAENSKSSSAWYSPDQHRHEPHKTDRIEGKIPSQRQASPQRGSTEPVSRRPQESRQQPRQKRRIPDGIFELGAKTIDSGWRDAVADQLAETLNSQLWEEIQKKRGSRQFCDNMAELAKTLVSCESN